MYRLQIEYYVTVRDIRINAVFEQEEHGNTQRLVNTGLSAPLPELFELRSHRDIVEDLDLYVPVLLRKVAARLETALPLE